MRSRSDPNCLRNHSYCPMTNNNNGHKKEELAPENTLHHSLANCDSNTTQVEHSQKNIELKLEAMENYLDGFYTKAKSDVRKIKKMVQDENLGT